jgi:hypothetical protein
LFAGQAQALVGFGLNDIKDGLGLGEVYPSSQKGSFREFPGQCFTSALIADRFQDLLNNEWSSMAIDLDHVLARIRPWGCHEGNENFVNGGPRSGVNDVTVSKSV